MNKYTWFENHEEDLAFSIVHKEGDKETPIAATDTSEKAHFIATACNAYKEPEPSAPSNDYPDEKDIEIGYQGTKLIVKEAIVEALKKDNDYWKKRCEAAEMVIDNITGSAINFNESMELWQQLKSNPPQKETNNP